MLNRSSYRIIFAVGVCLAALAPAAASAQDQTQSDTPQSEASPFDIVVTARKRDEKLQEVPVIVSAFNKQQLEAYAAGGIEDVAALTPGFIVDEGGGAGQGTITLRGVTTGNLNLASDQAISINIDGVQLSNADALRFGQYDLDQFELLKGPQALYFGKNSPGGIISLRTSDPTRDVFVEARSSYEFTGDETIGELTISGPITSTLGARGFIHASRIKGYTNNLAPNVADPRGQRRTDYFGRGTLKWEPSDAFDARFKFAYGKSDGGDQGVEQRYGCAAGGFLPLNGPIDDCVFNTNIVKSDPDPRLATVYHTFGAKPFSKVTPLLTSLELNFKMSDAISLSSVTGYSKIRYQNYGNLLPTVAAAFVGGTDNTTQSFSQELRVSSTFDGPVNFMVGTFFDIREFNNDQGQLVPAPTPPFPAGTRLLFANQQMVKSDSQSLFGQVSWKLAPTVELSAGGRFTQESKALSGTGALSASGAAPLLAGSFTQPVVAFGPFKPAPRRVNYNDFSPEVSLRWNPSNSLMAFAAYKQGFVSGGFNSSVTGSATLPTVPADQSYRPEDVKGIEGGIKSTPFPGFRFNVAGFRYIYNDIQLSTFDFSSGNGVSTRTVNATKVRTQGLEVEMLWAPQGIRGLTLNTNLNYNDARYIADYFDGCNGMQISGRRAGCDFRAQLGGAVPIAPGTGNAQNLKGFQLVRAPRWTGSAGFAYQGELSDGLKLALNGNAAYSSAYDAYVRYDPRARQQPFWILNAGIGLHASDKSWAVDLIGRNLTNRIFLTGSGGVLPLGGTSATSPGELQGPLSNPRTVMVQLTLRPSAF
ncbi:TonB-dependent receptor [Sphingorhabdus sp.]|uniref:TonB-dependent receptor n=1 Tax=Sphingorhabdus sp. TaxID=1902408 RepID=UPI0040548280